jgi:hypothetical protein
MWQEGLCTERRTSTCNFNEFAVQCVVRKKKFSRSDIQLSTIRNLNPYESKVFYEFLPNNRFVNPNLFIKPVPTPVPVPRTCTCTFLRVTAGSKRTSVQRTSVPSLKRLEPAVTRRKPVAVYFYLVPVPRTCTCTCTCTCTAVPRICTSYLYMYGCTYTCTCTSCLHLYLYPGTQYLHLYLYLFAPVLVPVPVPRLISFLGTFISLRERFIS